MLGKARAGLLKDIARLDHPLEFRIEAASDRRYIPEAGLPDVTGPHATGWMCPLRLW